MIPRLTLVAVVLFAPSLVAQSTDSTDVANAVRAYHTALATGDSVAALRLLAPDAVILESGGMESRAEYRSHHLPADIEFVMAVPSVRGAIAVTVAGDVAWAASTSTTEGTRGERKINSVGAELMVLSRTPEGWRIRAIHWSSRNRR
jgi:ketosteroid isomerase-like protein